MQSALLEEPELETRWYFRYFLGQLHKNFAVVLVDPKSKNTTPVRLAGPRRPGPPSRPRLTRPAARWSCRSSTTSAARFCGAAR